VSHADVFIADKQQVRADDAIAPRLSVRDLTVSFPGRSGTVTILERVSFECRADEILAIVGESGSGKTVTALSIMGLLPDGARVEGSIDLEGTQIAGAMPKTLTRIRGRKIAMIFQNPRASLNPCLTVGTQMVELIRRHDPVQSRPEARAKALEILRRLALREAEACLARYPHQLSGGMCQRIALGMALSTSPRLLIADEPTTALDVVVQAATLALLRDTVRRERVPMILITHDLGVVRAIATHVVVMYGGQVQEGGSVEDVLSRPAHPYTRALLAAVPSATRDAGRLEQIPGTPPDPARWPAGCRFRPRCALAKAKCAIAPDLAEMGPRAARCHWPLWAGSC
jgi:oligopeptide/dipeptide ABC transporter ATP-binding protein